MELLLVKDYEARENEDLRDRINFSSALQHQPAELRVSQVGSLQATVRYVAPKVDSVCWDVNLLRQVAALSQKRLDDSNFKTPAHYRPVLASTSDSYACWQTAATALEHLLTGRFRTRRVRRRRRVLSGSGAAPSASCGTPVAASAFMSAACGRAFMAPVNRGMRRTTSTSVLQQAA